jgi:hypothetical protein
MEKRKKLCKRQHKISQTLPFEFILAHNSLELFYCPARLKPIQINKALGSIHWLPALPFLIADYYAI